MYIKGSAAWAKPLNAPRQGSALPVTACQTMSNAIVVKKTQCLNVIANVFFFSGPDLQLLNARLKGVRSPPGGPYPLIIPLS